MSASVNRGFKIVKPVLSLSNQEAHTRVIGLYRAIYRYLPYIVKYYDNNKTENDYRNKAKEYFRRNADIEDVRIIDILVIKGYIELKEITHQWQQKGHVMANFCPSYEPKKQDFVSKFLRGP